MHHRLYIAPSLCRKPKSIFVAETASTKSMVVKVMDNRNANA